MPVVAEKQASAEEQVAFKLNKLKNKQAFNGVVEMADFQIISRLISFPSRAKSIIFVPIYYTAFFWYRLIQNFLNLVQDFSSSDCSIDESTLCSASLC
jgi:hypothetical protein